MAPKGLCKENNSKNPRLLWKWVVSGLTRIFLCGKSSQNSPKAVLIFWSSTPCVLCLYTLLKVVGYYDMSVVSMPGMGFQKKVWMGVGWWVELYPSIFWNIGILFNFAKPLNCM